MLLRLSLVALLVAWYQLPVMTERSTGIPLEGLSEPIHETLANLSDTIGQPVITLRESVEKWKADTAAQLLASPAVVIPAAAATAPATTPAAGAAVSKASSATAPGPVAPATDASSAKATKTDLLQQNKTVVLMGDSVMGEIFFSFKRWSSKNTAWKAIDGHKSSSGLSNTGYYDWPKVAGQLAGQYKPDMVLLTLGANDAQDIVQDKRWLHFGTDAWKTEYKLRMQHLVKEASQTGAKVYWLSLPVMREPGFERKMTVLRSVQAEALATMPQVQVVDATGTFADKQGHYLQRGPVQGKVRELRANDGIHLAPAGADVIVEAASQALNKG